MNQAVAEEVMAASQFPSSGFAAKANSLRENFASLCAKRDELNEKIKLAEQNVDFYKLQNLDPAAEVRKIRLELNGVEGKISAIRSDINDFFIAERKRHDKIKQALWCQLFEQIVRPYEAKLRETAETLRRVSEAFETYLAPEATDAPGAVSSIAKLEEGIAVFNAALAESGASAGNRILASDSIRGTLDHALRQNIRDSHLEEAINSLRAVLRLDPAKLLGGFATKV